MYKPSTNKLIFLLVCSFILNSITSISIGMNITAVANKLGSADPYIFVILEEICSIAFFVVVILELRKCTHNK